MEAWWRLQGQELPLETEVSHNGDLASTACFTCMKCRFTKRESRDGVCQTCSDFAADVTVYKMLAMFCLSCRVDLIRAAVPFWFRSSSKGKFIQINVVTYLRRARWVLIVSICPGCLSLSMGDHACVFLFSA